MDTYYLFKFLNILFICFQRQRKGGRKKGERKKRERNINPLPLACCQPGTWPTTQACGLTKNLTSNVSFFRMMPNPLSQQSGLDTYYLLDVVGVGHIKVNYTQKNVCSRGAYILVKRTQAGTKRNIILIHMSLLYHHGTKHAFCLHVK